MENQNENQDPSSQISDDLMSQGQQAGAYAGKKAKGGAKKIGKAVAKKTGAAFKGAIISMIKMFLPYIIGILILLGVFGFAYYAVVEYRGTQQQHSFDYGNELTKTETGYFEAKEDTLGYGSKTIRQFYSYFSGISYMQIVGNDNTKLIAPNDEKAVKDYNDKEDLYKLSKDLLFSLDEYMFEWRFKYPEQFIKPVNYDPDTLTLKDLTSEDGLISVESKERDDKGKETGKKIKSVRDYGIGSIFKYGEYERFENVTGTYTGMDVWNEATESVETIPINEPFDLVMDGFPEDIHLIDKAITFVGEFEYEYKMIAVRYRELKSGATDKENEDYTMYHYDTYYQEKSYVNSKGETVSYTIPHKLYKHRNEESAVFEIMPRGGVKENLDEDGNVKEPSEKYLRDYLYNFESYIPQDVMNEFNFKDRVGDFMDTDLEAGSGLNSKSFNNASSYYDIVAEMCEKYGISDPWIVIAMMAQESGGKYNINADGLMQVTGNSYTGTTTNGEKVTITASGDAKLDPRTNIEMGVIQFKNRLNDYGGDVFKAIQSYNFGYAGLNYIKDKYPESWDSMEWLEHREEARAYYGYKHYGRDSRSADDKDPSKKTWPIYGDTHYLEHVLRYYKGDMNGEVDGATSTLDNLKNLVSGIGSWFSSLIKIRGEEFENKEYKYYAKPTYVDDILTMAKTMTDKSLFSSTNTNSFMFWERGFLNAVSTEGMSPEELATVVPNLDGLYPPVHLPNMKSRITSLFSMRSLNGSTAFHKGVDVGIPVGTRLYTVAPGTVRRARYDSDPYGFGWFVKIDHDDGSMSVYAHMSDAREFGNSKGAYLTEGERVEAGDLVGFSGNSGYSTGPHLHFEYHVNGKPVDPYHIVLTAPHS